MPSLQHRAFSNALTIRVGSNSPIISVVVYTSHSDRLHAVSYHVFILQDIGISFFLAAGHNMGSSLLSMYASDAFDIFWITDDIYKIVNSMLSSAVRLFYLFQRLFNLAPFSCRHSAPMPPTCLSFWQCV